MATNWSGFVRNFHDFFKQQQQQDQPEPLIKSYFKRGLNNVKQTPTMKYLPTYRLESKKPVNKETVEKMMEKVITKSFEDFQYESKAAQKLAKSVSEELKYKFKTFEFDRFRVISIVTIGEKFYQGMESMCSFLWDPNADGFVNFTYETPQYFVIATLYYIYYD
ncbi:dynein light chain Tctex-type 5-B [Condylostylus longicornis]|uniref:dynein light chain Tctex-type 5-B n=1 Tax=Condylostylus longicornis TaxID=2530218 RepID=UPI00244DCDC5|nr:dynein light chain Tctex-type 5-B [Condylostylus longicornis]